MKLKRGVRYRMQYATKQAQRCPIFFGVGFFLLAVYYFAVRDLAACGWAEKLFCLILPLAASGVLIFVFAFLPLRDPRFFGVAAACLLLSNAMQGAFVDTFFPELLLLIWYISVAAVVVAVTFGYFPYPVLARAAVAATALLCLIVTFLRYLTAGRFAESLPHLAAAAFLLGIAALLGMLRSPQDD